MSDRVLNKAEISRVIEYAYLNDYTASECVNLLDSKGQHNITAEYVDRQYDNWHGGRIVILE